LDGQVVLSSVLGALCCGCGLQVLQLANAGDKGENRIAMIDDVLQYRLAKLNVMARATQVRVDSVR
jgi:hypothetical protein